VALLKTTFNDRANNNHRQ